MPNHTEIIEIKFKGQRRALYENVHQFPFRINDYAIVQADKGIDMGRVNQIGGFLSEQVGDDKLKKVIRKGEKADMAKFNKNIEDEKAAFDVCIEKLKKHRLGMKLVDCEFQFDRNKITFHFTAENRVDFRRLVKDIASVYRTRIEFRQIGVRDESRRLGGYGVCGRALCCSTWIRDFMPVTTSAAKDQNLPLNPSKLAGVCGRLKCCLMYERDFYNQAIKQYPQLAKPIKTEKGEGIVSNIDIFSESVIVLYDDDSTETLSLDYLREHVYKCDQSCGHDHGNFEELN